jgi:hypothetical protein
VNNLFVDYYDDCEYYLFVRTSVKVRVVSQLLPLQTHHQILQRWNRQWERISGKQVVHLRAVHCALQGINSSVRLASSTNIEGVYQLPLHRPQAKGMSGRHVLIGDISEFIPLLMQCQVAVKEEAVYLQCAGTETVLQRISVGIGEGVAALTSDTRDRRVLRAATRLSTSAWPPENREICLLRES